MTRHAPLLSLVTLLAACGGTAGTGGGGGAGGGGSGGEGGGGSGGAPIVESTGCDGVPLLAPPADPSARGPWPVGARVAQVGGLDVEIWYPAGLGSDAGQDAKVYDVRLWLPTDSQALVPDADNPWQTCDCFADLPLDDAHGPYPVVLFAHGTAGFRTQSLSSVVHWASRGFVVVAADHPGLYLGDALSFNLSNDVPGDLRAILDALAAPAGDLAFLSGRIDLARLGAVGHSAGGSAISGFGDVAQVLVPMAAGGADAGPALVSTAVLGALDDAVVQFSQTSAGYDATPAKKRLVGVSNAGHLAFSDLCGLQNAEGQDLVAIAKEHMVPNANLADLLWDGCDPGQLPQAEANVVVHGATAAALEETLHCRGADAFSAVQALPQVGTWQEALP